MLDSPVRGFPVGEFEARLERLHKLMSDKSLLGVIIGTLIFLAML